MYRIPVKIERLQRRQRSAGLVHILAGFFLMVIGSVRMNELFVHPAILVVGIISIIYGFFRKRIDPNARFNHWLRALQALAFLVKGITVINDGSIWMGVSLFLWAGVTFMLMFVERRMLKPTELELGRSGITVPGEFKDHLIPWELVNALVLRPDYVTITREDNSYTQLELTANLNESLIAQINSFAEEQARDKKDISND